VIQSERLDKIFHQNVRATKAEMLKRCEHSLGAGEIPSGPSLRVQDGRAVPSRELRRYHIPGRIEVLGKHTDYAGGRSMVAATENGLIMAVSSRDDRAMRVTNADKSQTITFDIDPELQPTKGTWANYPMTVARRAARNFPGAMRGVDIAISSDLPPAAGLSSSSALIIAIFIALADANDLWSRDEFRRNIKSIEDLGGYLGTNENGQTFGDLVGDRGVGTFGGSQDHTAILGGDPDRLKVYSYCPVRLEQTIDLPRDWTFVVASSGVVAEKTGSAMEKYNLASKRVSEIVEMWRAKSGREDATLCDAIHSSPDAREKLREMLSSQDLLDRFDQFVEESEQIVPAAARAIANSDRSALGSLVDRSQHLTENLLRNQTPQTAFLARSARELDAIAASAFGAGFGGSVWALIETSKAQQFQSRWAQRYRVKMPEFAATSVFFATRPGAAACRIQGNRE
jgi:galactokinase